MGNFQTLHDLPGVFRGVERRVSALERPARAQRRVIDLPGVTTVTATTAPQVLGSLDIAPDADGGAVGLFLMAGMAVAAAGGDLRVGVNFGSGLPAIEFQLARSTFVGSATNGEFRVTVPGTVDGANTNNGGAVVMACSGLNTIELVAGNVAGSTSWLIGAQLIAWAI